MINWTHQDVSPRLLSPGLVVVRDDSPTPSRSSVTSSSLFSSSEESPCVLLLLDFERTPGLEVGFRCDGVESRAADALPDPLPLVVPFALAIPYVERSTVALELAHLARDHLPRSRLVHVGQTEAVTDSGQPGRDGRDRGSGRLARSVNDFGRGGSTRESWRGSPLAASFRVTVKIEGRREGVFSHAKANRAGREGGGREREDEDVVPRLILKDEQLREVQRRWSTVKRGLEL